MTNFNQYLQTHCAEFYFVSGEVVADQSAFDSAYDYLTGDNFIGAYEDQEEFLSESLLQCFADTDAVSLVFDVIAGKADAGEIRAHYVKRLIESDYLHVLREYWQLEDEIDVVDLEHDRGLAYA